MLAGLCCGALSISHDVRWREELRVQTVLIDAQYVWMEKKIQREGGIALLYTASRVGIPSRNVGAN